MEVFDRCGDEWITAGMDGTRIALAGSSIEAAMNVSGIVDQRERTRTYDRVKTISRVIVGEFIKEKLKGACHDNGKPQS